MPSNPAFAIQLSLFCLACATDLLEPNSSSYAPGVSGGAASLISGRFRDGKLVGSGQHSKCFFAGVQCSRLMPA